MIFIYLSHTFNHYIFQCALQRESFLSLSKQLTCSDIKKKLRCYCEFTGDDTRYIYYETLLKQK